jgi:hypothetical protein
LIQRFIQRIGKNIESLHSYGCRKGGVSQNIDWQRQGEGSQAEQTAMENGDSLDRAAKASPARPPDQA